MKLRNKIINRSFGGIEIDEKNTMEINEKNVVIRATIGVGVREKKRQVKDTGKRVACVKMTKKIIEQMKQFGNLDSKASDSIDQII